MTLIRCWIRHCTISNRLELNVIKVFFLRKTFVKPKLCTFLVFLGHLFNLDQAVVYAESQIVLLRQVQPQPADQPVRRTCPHLQLQLCHVPVYTQQYNRMYSI